MEALLLLRLVLRGAANAALSYVLTERVLKRLSPPDESPGSREAELPRELGRREELTKECRRADRLEAELKEGRGPWWRNLW